MIVFNVGWWYRGTTGLFTPTCQAAAAHAIAWALHHSDNAAIEHGVRDTKIRIFLNLESERGAKIRGTVWFDYPGERAGADSHLRTKAGKAWTFQHEVARLPMDRNEVLYWWNHYVKDFLDMGSGVTNGEDAFTNGEQPCTQADPTDYLLSIMDSGTSHSLNAPALEPEVSLPSLKFASSGIVSTPGSFTSREDLPPAPPLPDDHPLNMCPGYPVTHLVSGTGETEFESIDSFSFFVPVDVAETINPQRAHYERVRMTRTDPVIDLGNGRMMACVHFDIVSTPSSPVIPPGDLQVRIINGEIRLEPVRAIPGYSMIFLVNSDVGSMGHIAVFISPDTNNGEEILGLFFVPPMDSLPTDWRRRAEGWALWSWGRPNSSLRIQAPPNTRIHTYPQIYIATILCDFLQLRKSASSSDWKIEGNVQMPPWLFGRHGLTLHETFSFE